MSDINFHKPYKGREDNRYTFKIQKLYEYQYTLQEITKELHKILKKMPEYRNRNNATINLEINEITNQYDIKKKDFILILGKFYEKKEKGETYNIEELFSVRKVLINLIETLQRDIERLPVPQNNNRLSNNLEENYNEPLNRLSNNLEENNMTKKEKLKMIRKEAEKLSSKLLKNKNLGRSTFQSNMQQMKQEDKEAKEAELLKQYYREEREKAVREYENHLIRVNRCSREEREKQVRKFKKQLRPMNSNNNNINNNNRFFNRFLERAVVWTGKEWITLLGNDAIGYWEGKNNALNFWHDFSNNNRNNNINNNINNNNKFGPERAVVWTGNGWITLLGESARAYNEGRWNEINGDARSTNSSNNNSLG
jgi:hypothetical protein